MNKKAVIFDLNGTLIRDHEFHKLAFRDVLANYGVQVSDDFFEQRIANRLNKQIWPSVFERELSEDEIKMYSAEKEAAYERLISTNLIEVEGLSPLLLSLKNQGLTLALATTSSLKSTTFLLNGLGLANIFDLIITGNDVKIGKPDPEIYNLTLQKLSLNPSDVITFEDSPQGVGSAHAAGIEVIGVATEYAPELLFQAGASSCVTDFRNVAIDLDKN